MDGTDVRVLKWLMNGFGRYPAKSEIRETIRSASRHLGIPESTLRTRVATLFESGLLKGWGVFVNPGLAGQRVAFCEFDIEPPATKYDVIEKTKLVDGVWLILDHFGDALGVGTYFENQPALDRKVELLRRLSNSNKITSYELLFPPSGYVFKAVDVRIIRAIQSDPNLAYSSIAAKAGTSSKTARKRLNTMIAQRALFTTLAFDLSKSRGALFAQYFVKFKDDQAMSKGTENIFHAYDSKIFAAAGGRTALGFTIISDNISDTRSILSEIRKIPGVEDSFFHIVERYVDLYRPFTDQVERLSAEKRSQLRHSIGAHG